MWVRALTFVAALTLSASAMAADRVVDLSSVQGVAALLTEAGYKTEIKMGQNDTSYIVSSVNGNPFNVNFYGCTNDKDCNSLDFYSWDKKEAFFSPAMANEWNTSHRFLKVAIDKDGDLSEFLSVSTLGNMTFANFKDYIDWFSSTETDLAKFLEEKRGSKSSS